ncbi:MAG: 12-oxophytodienoate reductase [Gammaproteobacteria bacterium]|nr:12-oxophytodienoate reductase [Gammaproteobacteria bacterium]
MNAGSTDLFAPLALGSLTLANRFVMPAMQRGFCKDGAPLPELAGYYARRAAGGVGLIISESAAVDHPSATRQPSAAHLNADTASSWARCVEAVHAAGGRMLLQLWHEGGLRSNADGGTLSPSGSACPGRMGGHAASLADLAALRDAFARSARLAQSIGADGVEVHAAHGYLLDQFLWAATNQRTDGYGGPDPAARARLPAEIVAAIRAACGPRFLISLRFSQWKENAYDARVAANPEELATLTRILREAGTDLFHASTRRFWTPEWDGSDLGLAGWTRRLGGLPTIAVGSVGLDRDVMESFHASDEAELRLAFALEELERRFANGEFDLVAVGRSLIADPDWVKKVQARDFAAVRAFRKADVAALSWEF